MNAALLVLLQVLILIVTAADYCLLGIYVRVGDAGNFVFEKRKRVFFFPFLFCRRGSAILSASKILLLYELYIHAEKKKTTTGAVSDLLYSGKPTMAAL